jgi:hypothetical protein
MDATAREQILEALGTTATRPGPGGDAVALAELADLLTLTALVERFNEQARLHLAPRPTVASHLLQAQEHLASLRRNLTHAAETLAYNTAQHLPRASAA